MADTVAIPPAPRGALHRMRDHGVYPALALLVLFNLAFTPHFATVANLRLQLVQVVPIAVVALGMALVVATRGIDLSVGSTMALAAAVLPLYLGYGPWPAIGVALVVGGRVLALVLADGRLVEIFDPTLGAIGNGSIAGVPVPVLVAGVLAVLVGILVRRTAFGRRLVGIGGHRTA